jgi:mannitol/fructose-specific phosphotransferase system IIA component (Ntr-type)/uncharacterized coiled-coil protein SlyX
MDTLLDALQEGRLIELPDNDKFHSLQFLAHIIEAIPSVPNGTDVAGLVLEREKSVITALGKSFACPHARVPYDEDLICSIGWSPAGIDYGASDNIPVHIIIMYLVPDNQRNHYLKEISVLAKALLANDNLELLKSAKDLNEIRNYLLDLVTNSKDMVGFEARARMIQLEARDTQAEQKLNQLSNVIVEPVTLIVSSNQRPIVLTQNRELVEILDKSNQLIESINSKGFYEQSGWRIIKRNSSEYQASRSLYECLGIKLLVGTKQTSQ